METPQQPINWQLFKSALERSPEKHLQFQYAEGQFVKASFHITEVKQAPIVSVDCGGTMNAWTEIIVQLWEPLDEQAERSMKVSKALLIINRVESLLPLNPLATVKIEFGNSRFDTRQMYPSEFVADATTLTISLTPDYTQCKALARGQSCGTSGSGEACAPSDEPTLALVQEEGSCCTPGAGCC